MKSQVRFVLLTVDGYFEKLDKSESLVRKTLCSWEQLCHLAACPAQYGPLAAGCYNFFSNTNVRSSAREAVHEIG